MPGLRCRVQGAGESSHGESRFSFHSVAARSAFSSGGGGGWEMCILLLWEPQSVWEHHWCGSSSSVGAAAVALAVGEALARLFVQPATLPFLLCKYYLWLDFLGDGAKLCVFNESCFILVRPTHPLK